MIRERVVPVALSVLVIVLVAILQERSRYLAAILATVPLTAPLAMWIVYGATRGDLGQTTEFTALYDRGRRGVAGLRARVLVRVPASVGVRPDARRRRGGLAGGRRASAPGRELAAMTPDTEGRAAFLAFLLRAKRHTYAGQGDDATVTPLLPGSKQLEYRELRYAGGSLV
jgi:hypothetical protein